MTIISVSPMMALSGVRSSWLMLETNCDLFSLAIASWRLLSWISSNSRTFSIAITAWSAKVVTSSICLSVNGSHLQRRIRIDDADRNAFAQQRHAENGAVPAQLLRTRASVIFGIGQHIGDVNDPAFEHGAAGDGRRGPARIG